MESIDQFVEQLIEQKGLKGLDDETRAGVKAELTQRLMEQIDRAAIEALPEEKAVELAKLADDPSFTNEQMMEFVRNSGVDLAQVALNTMVQFRDFYLTGAK